MIHLAVVTFNFKCDWRHSKSMTIFLKKNSKANCWKQVSWVELSWRSNWCSHFEFEISLDKELTKKTIDTKKTLTTDETDNKSRIEAIKQETFSAESEQDKPKRMQEIFQKNPSSYNGAIRENYSWSQSKQFWWIDC